MALLFGFCLTISYLVVSVVVIAKAQPFQRFPITDPNHYQPSTTSACYVDDEFGKKIAQRCVPDFINVAFQQPVEVTDTCGLAYPITYCVQTQHHLPFSKKSCGICDSRIPYLAHPASHLTDLHEGNNKTWWQSQTMNEGIKFPLSVNLTLRLDKAFDITYVRVKFVSPRPESFRIFKKAHADEDWTPWQYYSGSCRSTYKLPEKAPILPGNEAVAQCTREFSDISPLTGGNIAFPTLEGRPSAENFEESEVLQNWVTATEIRITLDRMNTFGDEIFGDPRVLRSYYWAISDFAVGGRCKCNGHASQCVKSTGQNQQQLVCDCKHHTTGVDCQQCEPFFVDRPWRPATSTEANECLPCNCNNLSNRCFFDEKLFESTGHGGHCIDCAGNTKGPHCEDCVENHWRRPGEYYCVTCQCNEVGSLEGQCDESGQCKCKPGIGGQFCDQCLPGYYDFSTTGCQDCRCETAGSYNNTPNCSPTDGACQCKVNVEGQRCDKCKPGYFHLTNANQFGCTPCFCFGHSSVCSSADGYYALNVTSEFIEDTERWIAGSDLRPEDVQWAQVDKAVAVSQIDEHPVYFLAPSKFTGDQRLAYNRDIVFTLRVQLPNPAPSKKDVVIVGATGLELSIPIFAQSNPIPGINEQTYRFRVHANNQLQWNPSLREIDFLGVLSNVTAIKVRGTYSRGDVGFLSNFRLGTASLTPAEDGEETQAAEWVETCKCTEGFVGQFCESCAPGYKRAHKFGGPLTKCIKCDCHGHSDSCDAESGACICQDNTAGDTCERCARGYYGDALNGTQQDCLKCDCPDNGPCIMLNDGDTICTECPDGYTGRKCENCANEYFGNPLQGTDCKKCDCSGNTDPNSIGNCDTITGECKKCILHTSGFNCEKCAGGYWGDALAEPKGDCKACNCYTPGTARPALSHYDLLLECAQSNGQCSCLPHVQGLQCNQCKAGYFNLTSGTGCQECNCDALGSVNTSCDLISGQCRCKPGVTGRQCDQCAPRHFGFSSEGCQMCDCDLTGSETPDCDVNSGQCLCKDSVEGRRCEQCSENRYSMQSGCLACDDCYTLIQSRKKTVNQSISSLRENLDEIQNNPVSVNDSQFDEKVSEVKGLVQELHNKAQKKLDGDDSQMRLHVSQLKDQLQNAGGLIKDVDGQLAQIDGNAGRVEAEFTKFNADKTIVKNELENAISYVETEGRSQLSKAQKAADRYGDKSQQLSEIAEQAKTLVDGQESKMKEIKELAEKAKNTSKQALSETNEAIFGATSTSLQIDKLYSKVKETDQLLKDTQSLAEEQSAEANKAYDAAARLLSEVESAKLPQILPSELKENAKNLIKESQQSLDNAKLKAKDNQQVLIDAQQALQQSRVDFQNVQAKQNEAERLLEEVEQFHNRAKEAFDLATKIWNEAKDSHDSLSDFQEKVQQSKEEALQELANLPDIERELAEAESTTKEAEQAVGDAKQNTNQALKVAEESKLKADNLIKESNQLTELTEATREQTSARSDSLNNLAGSIDSLGTTTKDFENQALSDTEKSQEVLRKATMAESSVKNLQEQLTESEKKLLGALDQLNSLENVDDDQLEELERLLEDSEKRYSESGTESQLKERIRKAEQDAGQQKRQIDALNKDLENLRSIRDSLPTKCFNLVNLEQEGQK